LSTFDNGFSDELLSVNIEMIFDRGIAHIRAVNITVV